MKKLFNFFKRNKKKKSTVGFPVFITIEAQSIPVCEYCLEFTDDFLNWVMHYHRICIKQAYIDSKYLYSVALLIHNSDWGLLREAYGHNLFLALLEYFAMNDNYKEATSMRDELRAYNLTLKHPLPSNLEDALKAL